MYFTKLAAAGVTAAVLAGAGVVGVFAQTTPKQAASSAFVDALAAKLGKTPDELKAAIVSTEKDLVAKAVQEGKLTQQQADKIDQRIDKAGGAGVLRAPVFAKARAKAAAVAKVGKTELSEAAQFLGLQPKDLAAQLKQGKSLAQVATDQGKSVDDLKKAIVDDAKTKLDAAVQSGKLTQQQADAALKKIQDNVDKLVNRQAKPRAPKKASI